MHVIHDLRIVLLVLADSLRSLRTGPHAESLTRDVNRLVRLLGSGLSMADELLVSTELKVPVTAIDVHDVIAANCDVIQGILGQDIRVETSMLQACVKLHR